VSSARARSTTACSLFSGRSANCAGRRPVAVPHRRRTIAPGATSLPVRGKALEIKADLRLRKTEHAGLKVRVGNGEETVVGYDATPARSTSTAPTRARATSPASSAPPGRPVTAGSASASSSTVVRRGVRGPGADGHHRPGVPPPEQRRRSAVRRRRKGEDQVARRLAAAVQLDARRRPVAGRLCSGGRPPLPTRTDRSRSASIVRRITAASASMPVQCRTLMTPWLTSIPSPSRTAQPALRRPG
jgi:hypothetical protein